MTHPIGPATVNVSVNMLATERQLLGRIAATRDMSLGSFIREISLSGLEHKFPDTAATIAAERGTYRARRLSVALT